MTRICWSSVTTGLLVCLAWMATSGSAHAQFGVVLSGAGPVNRSMGGASTAAPLDAMGALFWNPATLSGLKDSELDVGAEVLFAHPNVSSSVAPNAFGPGFPSGAMSGSTNSDSAGVLLPNVGLSQRLSEDSPLTIGLGLLTAGGFSTNFPASATNPVLSPQPPHGFGVGNVSADLEVFQIVPAASLQVTQNFSIGVAPILDLASLHISPLIVVPPDNAAGSGFASYPTDGSHSPYAAGGGVEAGAFLTLDGGWQFGASIKSPQWFEKIRFNDTNQLGLPRSDRVDFQFPLIASLGVAYTGIEKLLIASDFRYIDYRDASLFGGTGYNSSGAVQGAGWDSIFVVSVGAQYQLTDALSLRVGYDYNTNPQSGSVAFFNVAAPTIIQNTASFGLSWKMNEHLVTSLAYVHGFENSIEGPFRLPVGAIPGTSVTNTVSADGVSLGLSVHY